MAETNRQLIGQNYTTPDLVAKVTGKAKYAEDYGSRACCSPNCCSAPCRTRG